MIGTAHDFGDVPQVHGMSTVQANDQIGHVIARGEKLTDLHWRGGIGGNEIAGMRDDIGGRERMGERMNAEPVSGHALCIEPHVHDVIRSADRIDVARALDAQQLSFDGMCDLAQLVAAATRIGCPQRERDDRNIVDALGLDERLQYAQVLRPPVLMRVNGVV